MRETKNPDGESPEYPWLSPSGFLSHARGPRPLGSPRVIICAICVICGSRQWADGIIIKHKWNIFVSDNMLIPSIDLKGGKIVQLVQGEKLAIETDDLEGWIGRFSAFPKIQLIDLDAAMSVGTNDSLVRQIAARLPCRVGGGVRSVGRAQDLLETGAKEVIVGSAFFDMRRSADGGSVIKFDFAQALRDAVGLDRVIAAVDSRGGRVVIHGWRTTLPVTAVEAVKALDPYCGEFLYTHVDKEGLMQGTDMDAIRTVKEATNRRVTAAGGITTQEEIDALHALGIDAVVGMAIYTGSLVPRLSSG
jgi:phosphoribosylformimino-5-aminoimidazole carboxamide ribotide isomerase